MNQRKIIFIPGKNPKPPADQHHKLLWRVLLEGVRRAEPEIASNLSQYADNFKLIAWNDLYYRQNKDISSELAWIDVLINQHGPTERDIHEANAQHQRWDRFLYYLVDHLNFLLRFTPKPLQSTAEEMTRYFQNKHNIACKIRDLLKQPLRPLLTNNEKVLMIGHSLGSVIAYDTLWELSHLERLPGKIDLFLTLGSPLGMNYVRHRLMGNGWTGRKKYPANIRQWVNISAVGDMTSLNRVFADDFAPMLSLGIIDSIQDHCDGIYNFYHNELGLNCHRSYGYLVNPAVGKVIADWWQRSA